MTIINNTNFDIFNYPIGGIIMTVLHMDQKQNKYFTVNC